MTETPPEKCILQGSRFDVHAMELTGRDGKTYLREVIRHPGAVVLLPLVDRDRVVMIANARPSVAETLLELPAGTREQGETVMETAHRELVEETGYHAGGLVELHQFYSAPGICDELMHLIVASDLTAGEPAREATEQIENRIADREQVGQWIAEGRIRDAKTLVGLYAFLYSPQLESAASLASRSEYSRLPPRQTIYRNSISPGRTLAYPQLRFDDANLLAATMPRRTD